MIRTKVMIAITQSNQGGAQRYVYDLACALPSDRYNVVVVAGGNGALVDKLASAGIRTITLSSLVRSISFFGDIATFAALWKSIGKERPDILHTNSSKMGLIGGIIGRMRGVRKIVFTAHGWAFRAPHSAPIRLLLYVLSMKIVALSHRTIAVSEAIARDIPILVRRRCVVIHNGIPPIDFASRSDAHANIRRVCPSIQEGFWLGTVAELHPVKGIDVAIEAFSRIAHLLPGAQYIVAGEGTERARLQRLIEERGLAQRIHLIGFVDASTILKGFDAFVLPSRFEGLSYALLEASAASLPIIASRVGGIPEVITDEETGLLIAPGDTEALGAAILRVTRDVDLRNHLGSAASARVREYYSLAAMVAEIETVYDTR